MTHLHILLLHGTYLTGIFSNRKINIINRSNNNNNNNNKIVSQISGNCLVIKICI